MTFSICLISGRSNTAMANLIVNLGGAAEVLCFDRSELSAEDDRDLEMAKNVTSYSTRNPDRILVILAGNYHTRLERMVADPPFTPMGYYLSNVPTNSIDPSKVFAMMGRAEKGSYWACYTSNPDECGKKPFDQPSHYSTSVPYHRYILKEPQLEDGHNATLFVRTTSASLPLKDEFSHLQKCYYSAEQLGLFLTPRPNHIRK
jgi:hypothetical protein